MKIVLNKNSKSVVGRKKVAQQMSNRLQLALLAFPEKSLKTSDFRDIIWQITSPARPVLNFVEQSDDELGRVEIEKDIEMLNDYNYDHKITQTGFKVYLPNKDGIITSPHLVIAHEARHIFDYMCQPKTMVMRASKYITDDNANKFNEILTYISESEYKPQKVLGIFKRHNFEENLEARLKGLDREFIIDLLQRARHRLNSEINAYRDTSKCILKTFSNDILLGIYKAVCFNIHVNNKFEFQEKEKVVNKLLKKYIQEERANFG